MFGVIFVKTIFNLFLLKSAGHRWERAFPAALMMAQIGEFSFVLAGAGAANGALNADAYKLAIAVIAISLLVSPLWMISTRRFHEVAKAGVTDFRLALAQVYADEIHDFETGTQKMKKTTRHIMWRVRALPRMRRIRKKRLAAARQEIVTDQAVK